MTYKTTCFKALALLIFVSTSVFSYAQETTFTGIEFTGVFGGTIYDGVNYTSPTGSEPWGGFANEDVSIYPLSFTDGGSINFTGATAGTDADVYFRFEYNPYPDTEPSYNTVSVTVSGVDAASYSVDIPSQGSNTYSSFLLYVTTFDAPVSLTDVSVTSTFSSADVYGCTDPAADNYDSSATIDDGSCSFASSALTITTTVCSSASSVQMTGPWWGWDPNAGPAAVDNGDDTWTFTLDPAPTSDMEYLLVVDGVQESLIQSMIDGGSCAPITDYANYANRLWVIGSGNVTNVYGTCGSCATGDISGCTDPAAENYDSSATIDDGSCSFASSALTITTTVCSSAASVKMTGPWWGWDPNAGPDAVDNGDDTWTFTFDPAPTDNMEYLLVVDGVQEDLVASSSASADWSCAPITDYWSYANRLWEVGSGNVANVYGTCGECVTGDVPGCTDPSADNYNPIATTDDGSCAYPELFDITLSVNTANITVGPNGMYAGGGVFGDAIAVPLSDDGTGTWTGVATVNAGTSGNYIFLNSPANGGDWGTKEDLSGQPCGDPANWNDRILPEITSDITLLHCFGSCETDGSCPGVSDSGCTDPTANNYNSAVTIDDGSCTYGIAFTGVFGGTMYDGLTYTFPTGAEGWAGFANEDVSIYPISFSDGGQITFTGSTAGTDVDIYFRFEYNPYPDTEPSYNTSTLTVSGSEAS
ncbi:MAG: hypothetical protein HOH96_04965, partial [Flavobacteriales bacterium]|nr:hypothetical protein [Flavobacteriales bacterium]